MTHLAKYAAAALVLLLIHHGANAQTLSGHSIEAKGSTIMAGRPPIFPVGSPDFVVTVDRISDRELSFRCSVPCDEEHTVVAVCKALDIGREAGFVAIALGDGNYVAYLRSGEVAANAGARYAKSPIVSLSERLPPVLVGWFCVTPSQSR